jgi:hypothetical protein
VIRVMSIKKEKEQDQKVSCKPPKILTYFNIIPIILRRSRVIGDSFPEFGHIDSWK